MNNFTFKNKKHEFRDTFVHSRKFVVVVSLLHMSSVLNVFSSV